MPLPVGERLGPYEILAPIGAGGMGDVYSARDTRLHRDVAIKVSQERFSERFELEARAVAALNHPNVCHLYDVDSKYLVMELVEGPTLAERLKQGAIPMDEALNIARQIADALEAAHEKGIVHRDLKPGNIKIRPDGTVKVLDFGLAKVGGTPTVQTEHSPTLTVGPTEVGMILGTAAYMSPEQARGKPVDQRADIYSFGVVLYEMLTGEKLHQGDSNTEILASVIREDPQWDKVPPQGRRLLRRCLEKDPHKRLRHIGDVMALVDEAPIALTGAAPSSGNRWLWPVATAAALLIAALFAFLYLRPKPAPAAAIQRFAIAAPEQIGGQRSAVSVSPDGTRVVFSSIDQGNTNRLWVRRLDSLESRPLEGTEGAYGIPFWSPDSRFIAFGSQGKLKKIEAAGGSTQLLADGSVVYGGFWTADGRIVFSATTVNGGWSSLWEVPAAGGAVTPLSSVQHTAREGFYVPLLLPDGRHFVYLRESHGGGGSSTGIYVGSLDAKPAESAKRLLPDDSEVVYAQSLVHPDLGYLLFVRSASTVDPVGALMAQPFDLQKLELDGEPVPIADRVSSSGSRFSASQTGMLAYGAGTGSAIQLTWFDRQGEALGAAGEPGDHREIAISPDGARVAVSRLEPQGGEDLWMLDLARGVSTRFTFARGVNKYPVWSPDGKRIVFESDRGGRGDLYEKLSNGGGDEELLFQSEETKIPIGWSPDGRFLFFVASGPESWVLPLDTQGHAAGKPYLFMSGGGAGHFSPDMRWVVYVSNESGQYEVYVRPFDPKSANGSPPGAGKWQISTGGGRGPRWSANGKEIFYLALDGSFMAVDVAAGAAFQPGAPKVLFKPRGLVAAGTATRWDVSSDGKKFLLPISVAENAVAPFTVVLNWTSLLKK